MRWVYLAAAVLGAALPLSFLARFLAEHGLDLPLLVRQLFQTNVSAFFGVDVIISALALLVLVFFSGPRNESSLPNGGDTRDARRAGPNPSAQDALDVFESMKVYVDLRCEYGHQWGGVDVIRKVESLQSCVRVGDAWR